MGGTPGRTKRTGATQGGRNIIWEEIQRIIFAMRPHRWYSGVCKGAGGSRPPQNTQKRRPPDRHPGDRPNAHLGVPFPHDPPVRNNSPGGDEVKADGGFEIKLGGGLEFLEHI